MGTCSFFGHRNAELTESEATYLEELLVQLITQEGIDTFLFGSKSAFDSYCLELVTRLQQTYPHIKRLYYRTAPLKMPEYYKKYLLECYEGTEMAERIDKAGRATYVERNQEMILASNVCIFYYDEFYQPTPKKWSKKDLFPRKRNSGTKVAYEFAQQKYRAGTLSKIYNVFENNMDTTI